MKNTRQKLWLIVVKSEVRHLVIENTFKNGNPRKVVEALFATKPPPAQVKFRGEYRRTKSFALVQLSDAGSGDPTRMRAKLA